MTRHPSHRLAVGAASAVLLVLGALTFPAPAEAYAARTIETGAFAEPDRPGEREARSSLDLVITRDGPVQARNVAFARSRCDGCRAVAASLQVLVVTGETPDLDVGNLAVAVNESCASCEALAAAHQLVVLAGPDVRIAPATRIAVALLRERLRRLVDSPMPLDQLDAEVRALAAQLQDVVLAGLQERGLGIRSHTDVEEPEPQPAP